MYLSVTSKAIKKATMCEILLYFVLYSTRPRVGIPTRKNMFTANQYGFLGHEYSLFNLIASSLFALINASKIFFVLWPQCAEGLTPPLLQTPPSLYGHLLLLFFFSNPSLLIRLFLQYHPNETLDKEKNKLMWQSYVFIFKH